jgi:hypothetical protein
MWNEYISGDARKEGVLIGTPRSIRSDEWLLATPLLSSQSQNDFQQINPDYGYGEDTAVISDAPNRHWSTLFKPYNWSFFIAPLENALAFKWWFRAGTLLIATYLLLLLLTKRNLFLSITGSILLFFSPFIQWWYAAQVMEPITYGFLALYFAIRILNYETKKRLLIYSLALLYSMIAFALAFYPAFQIPILYVVIACFMGYILTNWQTVKTKIKPSAFALTASLIIAVTTLGLYYFSVKETIESIMNTSYPGARFINGGAFSLVHFLSGPYDFLLQFDGSRVPINFGNQSEAASFIFIVIYIILLPIIFYYCYTKLRLKEKFNYIHLTLLVLFLVNIAFTFFGFPDFLAKITLLYLVPENRLIIGDGIIAFLGIILFINELNEFITLQNKKSLAFTTSISTFIITAMIGRELFILHPQFIRSYLVILAVSGCFACFIFLLFNFKKNLAIMFLLGFSLLTAGAVNPLYIGLKPLKDSQLSAEILTINSEYNKENKRWVVYDSTIWGNFLAAQGIDTLSGTHLIPQLELWKKIDNSDSYRLNYNRYAHINFSSSDSKVLFENPYPDILKINLSPCDDFLEETNTEFILTETDLQSYSCLERIDQLGPKEQLNIYRIKE